MRGLLEAQAAQAEPGRRRGLAGQRELRQRERSARQRAAQLLEERSLTLRQGAALLGVSASALAEWSQLGAARVVALGRRPKRADAAARSAAIETLRQVGAHVGLDRLAAIHPAVPRSELRELLRRYRAWEAVAKLDGREEGEEREELEWLVPGAVWATDFTRIGADLPPSMNTSAPLALVVRDLASHRVLAVVPAQSENAAVVRETLEALIRVHGAPVVLKSDNGSGFVAEGARELCAREGVLQLYSPPGCPAYNGAVEASNAWLKRDVRHLLRAGAPAAGAADLLEAARTLRNSTGRPWGAGGPTPDERWLERAPISRCARFLLQLEVELCAAEQRKLRGLAPSAALSHEEEAEIGRYVIRRALVAHGFLVIRGRRISL